MGWLVNATPRPLYPRERPDTRSVGGWVGPRDGLDGCGKSHHHRDSIPGPSSPYRVDIPTELPRPTLFIDTSEICKMMWLLNTKMQYCRILNHSRYNCDQDMRRALEKSVLNLRSGLTLPPMEHVILLGGLSARAKPSDLYAVQHVKVKN
jgi:hypothetical protein